MADGSDQAGISPGRPVVVRPGRLRLLQRIEFALWSTSLPKDTDVVLKDAISQLTLFKINPAVRIEVAGHAVENEGVAGKRLAQQRCDRVRTALIRLGVDGHRLIAVGHAWEKPDPPPDWSVAPVAPWNPTPSPPKPSVTLEFIDDPSQ